MRERFILENSLHLIPHASIGNFVSNKIWHNTDIKNTLYKFQGNIGVTKGEYYASVFFLTF